MDSFMMWSSNGTPGMVTARGPSGSPDTVSDIHLSKATRMAFQSWPTATPSYGKTSRSRNGQVVRKPRFKRIGYRAEPSRMSALIFERVDARVFNREWPGYGVDIRRTPILYVRSRIDLNAGAMMLGEVSNKRLDHGCVIQFRHLLY